MLKLRRKSRNTKKIRQKAKIKRFAAFHLDISNMIFSQGKRRRGSIARDHYLDHNQGQDQEQEIELQGTNRKDQSKESP